MWGMLPALSVVAGCVMVACGGPAVGSKTYVHGKSETPEERAARERAAEAEANKALDEAVPKLWANMDTKERYKYMKSTVLPALKTSFETYNPKRFEKMNCETCHGPDPQARNYEMPNPDLPKISSANDFAAARKKYPGAVEFMMMSVEPTMAALLQDPAWTPKRPKGFGCFRCHTHAEGAPEK